MPEYQYTYKPGRKMMLFIILLRILFTTAVFATITFIFYNSAQVAEVSSGYSGEVTEVVNRILHILSFGIVLTEAVVRKLAHFAEFAVLGLCLTFCLRMYTKRLVAFCAWPLLLGLFIAVCDEFLQRFVPGRSSSVKDVLIDFCGICTGTAAAIVIVFAVGFAVWLLWGRKRKKQLKEQWLKEKEEIEAARAFLAQQKNSEA